MKVKIPYLNWRGGRPRWEPGPGLRTAGYRGQDLRGGDGEWLEEAAAIAKARELNAEVAAWRREGAPRRKPRVPRNDGRTARALWEDYAKSPYFARLSAGSQGDYRRKAAIFLELFGDAPVAALNKSLLQAWWQQLYEQRGHAMANACVAIVRRVLSHGEDLEWLRDNPAKRIRMLGVPPRTVVWEPAEIEALIAAADSSGRPSVGDAIIIALHSGQRQGDVLALQLEGLAGARVRLRQSKTGARVSIPATPPLETRLDAIRRRHAAGAIVDLTRSRRVVLDESGRDYTQSSFGKAWRAVRTLAAEQSGLPAIDEKKFLDLRDTAVTRLALAGCTIPEIRAITGHELDTVHQILRHYLALDGRMADAGIERLKTWMADEGIAI